MLDLRCTTRTLSGASSKAVFGVFAGLAALLAFACRDVTAPGESAARTQPARSIGTSSTVISPEDMGGWAFYNDQRDTVCTALANCLMVSGPASPPTGSGSAELAVGSATEGNALILASQKGTRFDSITTLSYATYRQSADAGNNLAIALQLVVDFDLADQFTGYQGRLVFEPYQGNSGGVSQDVWQTWNALAGKWWSTRSTVYRNGVAVTNPCVQATPCSWNELLTAFPNAGIHSTYGAVILKAGSGWANFRGNVDALTIGVGGTAVTYDFELHGQTVPPLPVDGVPEWIYADSNLVDGGDVIAGRVARNALIVAFVPGASVTDRAAALAQVGGTVVGGVSLEGDAEGFYYVRPSAGDTPAELLAARETLAALSQVAMAIPAINDVVDGDYLRPVDGQEATVWQVDPAKADGGNWAFESIAAPLAWGCSTGSADVRVAVVDGGFHALTDLVPNVVGITGYEPMDVRFDHGTKVASIVGARGNNGIGIAGMMWNASLQLWDRGSLSARIRSALAKDQVVGDVVQMANAANSGARIINLSGYVGFPANVSGIPDTAGVRRTIPNTAAGHAYIENKIRPLIKWLLNIRKGRPDAPLFVLSAGNGDDNQVGRDASLNGFPIMAQEDPTRVIVVAAARSLANHNLLTSFSNRGPLVTVAAPGEDVLALDRYGQPAMFTGTSAATPLAAGVAGLLLSFDPSMTVSELRDYVLDGALLGGQTTGGIPYLNAYESLKLAGRRQGAPLCGNRVWKAGDDVFAERTPNFVEPLFQLEPQAWQSSFISAYHGGRRIDMDFGREFDWNPVTRAFSEVPYRDTLYSANGGTFLSYDGSNHDGTRYVKALIGKADSTRFTAMARLYRVGSGAVLDSVPSPAFTLEPGTPMCATRDPADGSCVEWSRGGFYTTPEGGSGPGHRFFMSADASDSTVGYVVINIRQHNVSPVGWQPCWNGSYECVQVVDSSTSGSMRVFRVDFSAHTWTAIMLAPNQDFMPARTIEWLGTRETGDEIVWGIGQRDAVTNGSGVDNCTHQEINFVSLVDKPGVPAGTMLRRVHVPDGGICSGEYEAGATISSRVATSPATGPRAPSARSSPAKVSTRAVH